MNSPQGTAAASDEAATPSSDLLTRIAPRAITALWWLAAAAVATAHVWMIVLAFTHTPVDVDEGYNLGVVRHIAQGDGYASDGLLTTHQLDPFDYRVSTGPALLLPAAGLHALGVDLVFSGRIVGVLYYLALLAALAILGQRIAGRWAAVAAVGAVLSVDTFSNGWSPLYGPGDLLGEVAGAAFVAWAIVLIQRRPLVASALLGFAVLTKISAALIAPAAIVAFLLWRKDTWPRALRTLGIGAVIAALPTAAFELWRFAVLGREGYATFFDNFYAFATQELIPIPMTERKLEALSDAWFLSGRTALAAAIGLSLACLFALLYRGAWLKTRLLRDNGVVAAVAVGAVAIGIPVIQWLRSLSTFALYVRHPSPGLLLGVPILVAVTVFAIRALRPRDSVVGGAVVAAVGGALIATTLGTQASRHVDRASQDQRYGNLTVQRAAAEDVKLVGVDSIQGRWGILPAIAAMADVDAVWFNEAEVDTSIPLLIDRNEDSVTARGMDEFSDMWCDTVIVGPPYELCWPASEPGDSHD